MAPKLNHHGVGSAMNHDRIDCNKKRLVLIIILIALGLTFVMIGSVLWYRSANSVGIDCGPAIAAVEDALAKGGPVKDDLMRRGLVIITESGGQIKFGEVEKLVNSGVYSLDDQNYLRFGPNYSPP